MVGNRWSASRESRSSGDGARAPPGRPVGGPVPQDRWPRTGSATGDADAWTGMRSPPIVPDEERPADELGATIIRGQYEDSVPQRGIACGTERALTTGRIRAAARSRL